VSARVLITGAAGGIGAATAAALRARGAEVAGLDLNGRDPDRTSPEPGGGETIACDVRDQASVDRAVAAAIERLGGLDVLINCAGAGDPQSAAERPSEDAQRVLDVNLLGPWRVTAAAMPALEASRGRVVNVASGLAHFALPFAPAYCMSKRGLTAYSDALRLECGGRVAVTTVYPGYIRTPIHDASAAKGIALEGMVPPERLTDAVGTLVRAALGRPRRDLATTPMGAVGYALARLAPRRLVDRAVWRRVRRAARRGDFDGSELAAGLRAELIGSGRIVG
jgi:NAD(P)-dependent dehydrogenase (short-subunit alcohol dehydrogenase family)